MSEEPYKILFFGDSTCVGQGVSLYKGWVTKIAKEFDGLMTPGGQEICVINSSINGRTSRQALEDMPYHVQSQKAGTVIVQFGLNDCNYWATDCGVPRVSRDAFVANIQEIVTRLGKFSVDHVIVNTNHPTTRNKTIMPNTDITYQESNEQYNAALRDSAHSFGKNVHLIDIEAEFRDCVSDVELPNYLLEDGLHLSELGHDLYFKKTFGIIKALVLGKK
ncbi:MAG: SGNH/GDSL hydrolase family protein [Parvibaculales bacterium]